MSKLKVGDRVRMRLQDVIADCVVREIPNGNELYYVVVAESDDRWWMCLRSELRRLVKRKRVRTAAPDRVMVAAAVFGGLVDEKQRSLYVQAWGNERIRQTIADAFTIADALIADGAK